MKIYTKTGDGGETGLFAGPRVGKDDARIEAYGTVDELNALLGVVRTAGVSPEIDAIVEKVQNDLFGVGAELATPDPKAKGIRRITAAEVTPLEDAIDRLDARLPRLKQFILPGGSPAAAQLHFARTVCRRAERRVVALAHRGESVSDYVLTYLNRLSDLLFVLARAANQDDGQAETTWSQS